MVVVEVWSKKYTN